MNITLLLASVSGDYWSNEWVLKNWEGIGIRPITGVSSFRIILRGKVAPPCPLQKLSVCIYNCWHNCKAVFLRLVFLLNYTFWVSSTLLTQIPSFHPESRAVNRTYWIIYSKPVQILTVATFVYLLICFTSGLITFAVAIAAFWHAFCR